MDGLGGWLKPLVLHPITLIAVGSAVGGNLRYWLGRWIDAQPWAVGLPWGTFVINVSGSFVLGLVAVVAGDRLAPSRRELSLLLGTGFCGGYTTFSTFEWETLQLLRGDRWPAALAYVLGSVGCGFVAAFAGVLLAGLLVGRR